ncbi:GrpB family protein [Slackia heliotrinireducens]|uniref:GrpB family protein n=1 Tax=Slackia heliotrinireducens TaxID=84110 RepID=UPI003314A31E
MGKDLPDMTLEELWELFPISLVEHNDAWRQQYAEIASDIAELLSDYPVERISHIGSTAVDGIWAKSIVDVMVELSAGADMKKAAEALEGADFIMMSNEGNRISLNLGYTKDGFAEKVYHVHLRRTGDNDELYFRDYLNAHPQTAKDYEALKLRLWKQFEHDRDAYTDAKAEFIKAVTAKAREEYTGRY